MTRKSVYTLRGRITRKERNTAIKVAAAAAGGMGARFLLARPGIAVRAAKQTSKAVAGYGALAPAYPALRKDRKLALMYGGTGKVKPLSEVSPYTRRYGLAPRYILVPEYGFGISNVPIGSSRLIPYSDYQSRRERSSSSYQQNGGSPWAQRKRRTQGSSYIPRNRVSRRGGGQGRRYFRRGIASRSPYCYIHKKRHWCWNTRKR